jgi:hypothetical protein
MPACKSAMKSPPPPLYTTAAALLPPLHFSGGSSGHAGKSGLSIWGNVGLGCTRPLLLSQRRRRRHHCVHEKAVFR